jgi:hypothetical protein
MIIRILLLLVVCTALRADHSIDCYTLHRQIETVCPIIGVSIGDAEDKTTWKIYFKDEATEDQRAQAQAVIDAWTEHDWEGPMPERKAKSLNQVIAVSNRIVAINRLLVIHPYHEGLQAALKKTIEEETAAWAEYDK